MKTPFLLAAVATTIALAVGGCGSSSGDDSSTPVTRTADVEALRDAIAAFQGTQEEVLDQASACEAEVGGEDAAADSWTEDPTGGAYGECFAAKALPVRKEGEDALEAAFMAILPRLGPTCRSSVRALLAKPADMRNLGLDSLVETCAAEAG
jgi:hypothetical protein